jgi:hypothetical protein
MNKNLLLALALAGSTLLGITGCGDDPVTIQPDPKFSFTANEKFTYESTPRDMSQAPAPAEKRKVVWTVLQTGLTVGGRTEVSKVLEQRMGADSTTVESTDTLYFSANALGEFYQYDLIGSVARRIPAAALISGEIPPTWTKIGDTKNASALSYVATTESTITVTVSGIPVSVTYSVRGEHKGKTSVTVPKKTTATAFSTDLIVKLKASALGNPITNDSLTMNYAMDVTDGILKQSQESKTIIFKDPATGIDSPQAIAGFDFLLKSRP